MTTMAMDVRFKPQESFLPEGLQPTTLWSRNAIAGITIQVGKEAKHGGLWFHFTDTGTTEYISLEGHGRPGWFRPTNRPDHFLVGMEQRVCVVEVKQGASIKVETLHSFEDTCGSPRIMMNDGCVSPSNQIICGFKDAQFSLQERIAFTKVVQADGKSVTTLARNEVCPNGNCFVHMKGELHLLHIETPSKRLIAIPASTLADNDAATAPTASLLVDFGDRTLFDAFEPSIWHEALLPDGMCCWRAAGDITKVAVAIFDFRPSTPLRSGQVVQFSVDAQGHVAVDAVYTTPGSPRVTHPAIIMDGDGCAHLWATTADEGLVDAVLSSNGGDGVDTTRVGACFSVALPQQHQPLPDDTPCNLPYTLPS